MTLCKSLEQSRTAAAVSVAYITTEVTGTAHAPLVADFMKRTILKGSDITENKRYYFIFKKIGQGTDSESVFFEELTWKSTGNLTFSKKLEEAVSFSSQSRAENYARKFLSPFMNTFELKIIAIYGDYSQNECLFKDI